MVEAFNKAMIKALETGEYICQECGATMVFEDDQEYTLVCLECGWSTDLDHYGYTDEEYADMEAEIREDMYKYDKDLMEIMDLLAEDDEDW
mgnify:CR=1 FL=1